MDPGLVALAQNGDERAFVEVATAISGRLYGIAHRILRDHDQADDAAQQAIVSIWRELPGLRDPSRFEAWAYRIVVRACYAEARRRLGSEIGLEEMGLAGPDDALLLADRDQLDRGFRRLPPEQRAVLVLQHYLGMELPEIAEILGVPLGTVKSRTHAARRAMRAALEADARPAEGAQMA